MTTTKITKKQLMAKARGFTASIEKMDEKQHTQTPTGDYGEDYNRLRVLTAQLCPDLAEILPPPVRIWEAAGGSHFTKQSYGEIDTYCEQIFQLLSEQE